MQLSTTDQIFPLREFIVQMTKLVERESSEVSLVNESKKYLQTLISTDAWLPEFCTIPHPDYYQQYLLHADPLERFSVVSFVWGAGQKTPVHDHMTWGLIGMLRGQEIDTHYFKQADGSYVRGESHVLTPGNVCSVSPATHDVHEVANFYADQTSISIHVYGGNIGRISRHVFDPATGAAKTFISGYNSEVVPNLWN